MPLGRIVSCVTQLFCGTSSDMAGRKLKGDKWLCRLCLTWCQQEAMYAPMDLSRPGEALCIDSIDSKAMVKTPLTRTF